jgi:tetratricopeptide (TPR) repeat protein
MTQETSSRTGPTQSRIAFRKRLLLAASLVRARAFAAARREIREVFDGIQDDPEALVAAGLLSFVTRDYDRAISALTRADTIHPHAGIIWQRFERTNRLGWDREAIQVLEEAVERQPNEPTWHASLLAIRAKRQSYVEALKHGEAVLAEAPDLLPVQIEVAGIHAALGNARATVLQLQRVMERANRGPIFLEAGRIARSIGVFAAARTYFTKALTFADCAEQAHLFSSELALWSGQLNDADEHVQEAEKIEVSAASKRILGIIAYLRGNRDSARNYFEAALKIDKKESEAYAWLAEIALREKRYEDAHALISSTIATARGIVLSAYFLRLRLLLEYDDPEPAPPVPHLTDHLREALLALVPEIPTPLAETDIPTASLILDRALERMFGNRSVVPTYLQKGELFLVRGVRDPRTASRQILERIQVDPPEMLLAEFDELAAKFPASSLPLVHKGELFLWLGQLEESRKMLRRAIERVNGTRWAYIGLSLIEILEGKLEEALEVLAYGISVMSNTEGPAVFVHRAEALRLLGRDAEPDLMRAIKSNPSRVSAHMNLALVRLGQGREKEARQLVGQAIDVIPGLFSDAASELGLDQITDDLERVDSEILRQVVEQALKMMRGNRSSTCITYITRSGRIRFGRRMGTTADPLHARDEADVLLAVRVLQNGLSALPSRWRQAKDRAPAG